MIQSILCIDDSPADQLIFAHRVRFADSSIRICQVIDGQEAIDVLRQGDFVPDVIFLDISMPGMPGAEFVRAYEREFDRDERCDIIVVSSSIDPRDDYWVEEQVSIRGRLVKPLGKDWYEEALAILGAPT